MIARHFVLTIVSLVSFSFAKAQTAKADSAAAATALQTLLSICKNVDFVDPNTTKLGTFYKAAPYIVYQGNDKKRAWKSFANYNNTEEKKQVDAICTRINRSANRDSSYKIVKYITQKESEGLWHVLMVSYFQNGAEERLAFAFLKIGKRFGLGDID